MRSNLTGWKVLVTGCAGFIPSYVAERCLAAGASVYGVDNLSTGTVENMATFVRNRRFHFVHGDVRDAPLLTRLIARSDYVYHGAIRGVAVSVDTPELELQVNTASTLMILEAIRRSGVRRFIYPSSASVYGNHQHMPESETDAVFPRSPYGVSKLAGEQYCLAYHHLFKIPVVCLRYFNTYGPRQRADSFYGGVISIFIDRALRGKPLKIYGDGEQTRDFTYIDDNLQATMRAFTAPRVIGRVINVASGQEYTINALAEVVRKVSGNRDLEITYVPKRIIDNVDRRQGDIRLARRLLGYAPQRSLAFGIRETYHGN